MAIEYVGGQTQALPLAASTTITFSLSGGLGSVPADGDLVIVSIAVASGSDAVIGVNTGGYAELTELFANDGRDTNLSLSWKIMGTTPDSSVVVTGKSTSTSAGVAVIHVYRGVDATTPFDVTSATSTGIDGGIPDPPAITPTTSGALIVVAAANAHSGDSAGTFSASYLSNFSTLVDASGGTYDCTSGIGSVPWTSGAYNPAAWIFGAPDGGSYSNASVTMALRPAASSGVTGTASGTADVIGSASASVAVSAAGSGTSGVTGSAAGSVAVLASAEGTATITGAASGAVLVDAQASGAASITGAASGAVSVSAVMAGETSVTGTASAAVQISAAGSGEATVTGSATGTVGDSGITGTASGEVSVTGAAVAAVQVSADAAGAVTVTGAAAASVAVTSSAQGEASVSGSAIAAVQVRGSLVGSADVTGQAVGSIVSRVTTLQIAGVVSATTIAGTVQAQTVAGLARGHSVSGIVAASRIAGRVSGHIITGFWRAA